MIMSGVLNSKSVALFAYCSGVTAAIALCVVHLNQIFEIDLLELNIKVFIHSL